MALPTLTKTPAQVWPDATTIDPEDCRVLLEELRQAVDSALRGTALIGGAFVASVAGNVLTVSIKTLDGNDPSTAKPVYADFRHVTPANGQSSLLAITAAHSFTLSGGATAGFSDGVPGRLWVTLFNDGGSPELGVVNCRGADGNIFPLESSLVASSTDEAGDGSADSAGVIYTDGAVASKAMIVLGHMTWETALATAGLWSAAPDTVHQLRLGDHLPGAIIQRATAVSAAVDTTTTVTPLDDTIPQVGEGKTLLSKAITFKSKANLYDVDAHLQLAISAAGSIVGAVHQDSVGNALAARHQRADSSNASFLLSLKHRGITLTTTSTTFKANAGPTTGTLTFNGANAGRLMGGIGTSRLEITELMA